MKARDNPFSTSRVLKVRYRTAAWTWPELWSRLEALNYRAAIVGPHGSGKTTLMEDMAPELEARGFTLQALHLNEEQRRIDPAWRRELAERVGPEDCLMLDGAEQLGTWGWWRFRRQFAHAGGMVISTHEPGWLPTLVTCRTSPGLLEEILGELVDWPAAEVRTTARAYHARHGGNLREALRELYDREAVGSPLDT